MLFRSEYYHNSSNPNTPARPYRDASNRPNVGNKAFYSVKPAVPSEGGSAGIRLKNYWGKIGEYAFADGKLVSGEVPAAEEIGNCAFRYTELKPATVPDRTLYIPNTVKKIGKEAFRQYNREESLGRPNGLVFQGNNLRSIGDEAFGVMDITEVTLPAGLREIGRAAFGNGLLTTVDLSRT